MLGTVSLLELARGNEVAARASQQLALQRLAHVGDERMAKYVNELWGKACEKRGLSP